MKSDFDPRSEIPDPISDQQLDELLKLATPQLEPNRQQRLRVSVANSLVEPLVEKSNSPLWQLSTMSRVIVATLVASIAIAVCWSVIGHRSNDSVTPVAAVPSADQELPVESKLVNVEPSVDPSSEASKNTKISNETPAIISRVIYHDHKDPRRTAGNQRKPESSWCLDYRTIKRQFRNSAVNQIDQTILKIANSSTALKMVEHVTLQIDQAVASQQVQYYESRRLARKTSTLRGTLKTHVSSAAEVNRQWRILKMTRGKMETYLVRNAETKTPQLATASYRLLCRCGTQRSLPWVLQQWVRPANRLDASLAAGRLADSQTLASMVLATEETQIQILLMTRLLEKGDPQSLDLFLQLTTKNNLYREAQASGALAKKVPMERLLNRLNSNRRALARAAAITLSACDDPRITAELIRNCDNPVYRQSAWMALTIRTDTTAQRFVNQSTADIRWAATVNAAQIQWSQQTALN